MTYVSSPSSSDQSQPPNPPFPPGAGGAGEFLPSTLNGKGGLKVGRAGVQRGWGVPALPLPIPTPSCPSILSSIPPPAGDEDLLFSIIYNLRLGPPVLSSPLT